MAERIYFRNNGEVDALTLTMAPKIFLANLNREILRAQREMRDVSLVWFLLRRRIAPPPIVIQEPWQDFAPPNHSVEPHVAIIEETLIEIAHHLNLLLRSDEFFSRMYENGFLCFISGSYEAATASKSRIFFDLTRRFSGRIETLGMFLDSDILVRMKNESSSELILRADAAIFRK